VLSYQAVHSHIGSATAIFHCITRKRIGGIPNGMRIDDVEGMILKSDVNEPFDKACYRRGASDLFTHWGHKNRVVGVTTGEGRPDWPH
jgi:hypothetical protein